MGQSQEIWSLEKCINHALENNITVKQFELADQMAELNLKESEHSRYPNLGINSSSGYNFGRTIDPVTNQFENQTIRYSSFQLNTGVMLFGGGQISNTIKQNREEALAAREDLKQARNDVALNVATVYLNVLFAQERLTTANQRLELSTEQLVQVDKQIKAGALPLNERLQLEAQLALDEQAIIEAENTLDLAYLNLKQALQLDPFLNIQIEVPDLDPDSSSEVESLTTEYVYQQAYNNQPEIKAARIRRASADIGVDLAKAGFYPTLSLFGNVNTTYSSLTLIPTGEFETVTTPLTFRIQGMDVDAEIVSQSPLLEEPTYFRQLEDNFGQGIGISLNVPILSNYRNKAAVERAKISVQNTHLEGTLVEQNLKTEVQQAVSNVKSAARAYFAANKTLEAQGAAYNNTLRKFELGAANSFELSTSKTNLDNSRIEAVIAKYDYIFKQKVVDYYLGREIKL
jgi:outer membrane protein